MALLNNYYLFVIDESKKRGVEVSQHPVEKGADVTDNVKRKPVVISINGEIVGKNAKSVLAKIEKLHQNGKLVKYVGQNILSNALITSFDTEHPNTIYGGCAFSMEITEIRIAKSPLVVKKTSTKKQVKKSTKNTTKKTAAPKPVVRKYTVKRGDTLWAIAKKYYGSGAKYPTIYNANKNKIKNPNVIQVGWVLVIP
jgi:nucleoid-associated protein YgaU